MLKKLYELGCLNLEKLIFKYTKELSLSSDECAVLIKIIDLIYSNKDINEEEIAKSLKLEVDFVSNTMARFIEQGYLGLNVEIIHGIGKEKYSIDSLFKTFEVVLNDDVESETDESSDIISFLETKFSRVLSSRELDIVSDWKDNNITRDDVENACANLEARDYGLTVTRIEKELFKLTRTGSSTVDKIDRLLEKSRNGFLS